MKKFSLATALYLSTAAFAFADSNSLIITQASVGAGAPSLNFTQSGSGALASIIQNGNNALTGVQVGTDGTKLNVDQENPTAGAVNTINYTGRGNSNTTVYQRASNGIFTAGGSAGNTANIDMSDNTISTLPNTLTLDQVGFNNKATAYSSFTGYSTFTTLRDNWQIAQYSDSAASGNTAQVTNNGLHAGEALLLVQQGGNVANISYVGGGGQSTGLTQTNTADNAAVGNTANVLFGYNGFGSAIFSFTQTGTQNNLLANLGGTTVNYGMKGWQNGTGNQATVTQNNSYLDGATGQDAVYQTGNNNTATGTQNNTHNSIFTIQQNGNGNSASVLQSGTSNVASLTQQGNVNTASLTQSGTGATAIIAQH